MVWPFMTLMLVLGLSKLKEPSRRGRRDVFLDEERDGLLGEPLS